MSPQDWSAVIVASLAVISAVYGLLRWLVKGWLVELKPNGGSSLRDAVNRLDAQAKEQSKRIDNIHEMLLTLINRKR